MTIDDSQKHFIYKGSCKIDVQSLPQQFHSIQQMLGCNEAFVSNFNGNFSLKCFKNSCDGQFVLEMIE